MSGKDKFW